MRKYVVYYFEKQFNYRTGKQTKSHEVCYTLKAENEKDAENIFLHLAFCSGKIENFDDKKNFSISECY